VAGKPKDIDVDELWQMAMAYADDCIEATKEVATPRGAVDIKERHIPTISYFLDHWLRRERFDFYGRGNWYAIQKDSEHPCFDTIKRIDKMFNSLATDIVANEGKGIFYAKNKLGMTDKAEVKSDNSVKLTGELGVTVVSSGVPLANKESDVGTV
jgi:hypothetical protein